MRILVVDSETTGIDHSRNKVVEIAGISYDTQHRCVVQQASTLIPVTRSEFGGFDIHGIPEALATSPEWQPAYNAIARWFDNTPCDYTMAFNAPFDKTFFGQLDLLQDAKWIDAQLIPWQHHKANPSLIELCVAYGVPVVNAHRALDDCQLLAALLGKLGDIDLAIEQALEQRVTLVAFVSYDNRELAKAAGFSWNRAVKGAWSKSVRQSEAAEARQGLPFECEVKS